MAKPLNLYLIIVFLLAIVMGLQIVTVPWLAIDYLNLSPAAIGVVQAGLLIPSVLLLVLGGINADKGAVITKLLLILIIYGFVHCYLLFMINLDLLNFLALMVYALMLGCVGAFIQPCKDCLVGYLAEAQLQKYIAKNNLCQNVGLVIGILIASWLYAWHTSSIPIAQIIFVGIAVVSLWFLSKNHSIVNIFPKKNSTKESSVSLLFSGFINCWQSKVLRSLVGVVAVNGFFHIGVFIVALPLLARDVYLGDIGLYSWLQCLFILGSIVITVVVIIKEQLDAPGRRVIFSLLYGGLILLGLSMGPTQVGMMFLIFLWGVVVGVSAILGRTILQSQVINEYRGRLISIYQLALFGFAPLGSLFAGIAIEYWGVLFVLKLSAIASFVAFSATFFTRSLWELEAETINTTL